MTIAYCRALVQVCRIPAAKDTYCQVSTTAWRKSETWMARTVFFAGLSAVSREIIVSRHFRHQRLMWHIAPVLRPRCQLAWRGVTRRKNTSGGWFSSVTTLPRCHSRATMREDVLARDLTTHPHSPNQQGFEPSGTTPGPEARFIRSTGHEEKGHRRAQRHLGLTPTATPTPPQPERTPPCATTPGADPHRDTDPAATRKDTAVRNDTWG
jgi:hypothetical protein